MTYNNPLKLLTVLALASIIVGSILFWMGPRNIVQLEVAGEPTAAKSILKSYARHGFGQDRVREQLQVDFVFILTYVSFAWMACKIASGFYATPALARLSSAIGSLQLFTGAFDVLENIALLRFLSSISPEYWLKISLWAALAKFTLLCLGLFISGAGFVAGKQGPTSTGRCVFGAILLLLGLLVIRQLLSNLSLVESAREV